MECTVHGILQARILKWVAFPFSRGSSQARDWTQVSRIADGFFTSWATGEAQEYWSGCPVPSPANLPDPGIKPGPPALQVDSLPTKLSGKPCNYGGSGLNSGSPGGARAKESANRYTVWSLGREDPLEEEMATHSSMHAWVTPWTKEPGYGP